MKRITLHDVEHIAFALSREHLTYNEPIPDFRTRYPKVLESCLAAPFATFGKADLYPSLVAKVGALFYFMIKNHPFQNGNKRIAMTTMFVALTRNNKWLKVDIRVLYNFAVWVAESPSDAKEEVMRYIQKFLTKYMVPFSES